MVLEIKGHNTPITTATKCSRRHIHFVMSIFIIYREIGLEISCELFASIARRSSKVFQLDFTDKTWAVTPEQCHGDPKASKKNTESRGV